MYFRIDTATEEPLQLNEDFSLHVLGERGAQIGQGKLVKLVGRHLIAYRFRAVKEACSWKRWVAGAKVGRASFLLRWSTP
jgi:hypothetical protein